VAAERLDATFAVVDKFEREGVDRARERLRTEVGLDEAAVRSILALFAEGGREVVRELFGSHDEVAAELDRLGAYVETLSAMGLGDFVEIDLTIVRGLAYYTGIVFELFDRTGELRAICGGGRYDRLLELVGGEPLPAVGFGMGDVVLTELLRDRGLLPAAGRRVDYFLVIIGEEQRPLALGLAHALRERGHSVLYGLREQSVRKQFRAAETEGAREALVLGPDEARAGEAVVRDMVSGQERRLALEELRGG
jgi:histidyl-tRNA synthetase